MADVVARIGAMKWPMPPMALDDMIVDDRRGQGEHVCSGNDPYPRFASTPDSER
jgi:hypothetical protein